MAALPEPSANDLPPGTVIAVPAGALTVYRLVRTDPPTLRDFRPPSAELAAGRGWPELLRVGLSHFLEAEQARRVRRTPLSFVARVELPQAQGVYVARTGRQAGHVTVWAPPTALLEAARVVE